MECLNINIKEIKDLVDVYGEVMTSKILDYFPEKIPTAKEIQELANNGYFKGIDVNNIMSISLNNKIDTFQQQGRISKKSKFSPVLSSETLPYLVELRDLEILRERLEGTTNEITYKDSRNNKAVIFEGDIYTYENYQLRVNGKPMTYAIFDEVIERVRERKNDIINHFKVLKSNLLRDIYENDDSYYKSLSDLLLNHIDKLSENPVTYKVYNNPKTGGQYDYGEDRLTLAMYNEYIFLHELIHNFTSLTLYKIDYGLENSMDGLLGNKLEIDFYRKIHELYQLAKRRTNDKNLYGYKNIHEFVAEAFTSKKFQEDLRLINLGEKANYTTWQRLLDILTNHLGYMTNKSQRNVLDETISITLDYITKSPYIDRNFDTININKDLDDAEGFLAYLNIVF